MKDNTNNNNLDHEEKLNLQDYPLYLTSEDIYSKFQKAENIDPEDITSTKNVNEKKGTGLANNKDFQNDVLGNDLDIPGSELDDEQENMGSEDEENNYYSLGGDNHNDLEEDKGE